MAFNALTRPGDDRRPMDWQFAVASSRRTCSREFAAMGMRSGQPWVWTEPVPALFVVVLALRRNGRKPLNSFTNGAKKAIPRLHAWNFGRATVHRGSVA